METEKLYEIFRGCSGVTTDSRTIRGGELFFALKGENFDGNAFASKALEAGAAYAVVEGGSAFAGAGDRYIAVPDTLAALKHLAAYHRRHVREGLPVVGLTGTNGKTTTKELVRAVLSSKFRVTATEGNFNNEIGVPLSVLRITPDTEIAVIEMGASHPGDIESLVAVSQPDMGLITNVGVGHIEGFGSFDWVKKTKGELYDYLCAHGGLAFVDVDNRDLVEMAAERPGLAVKGYGMSVSESMVLPADASHPYLRMAIPENYGVKGETLSDCLPVLETRLVGSYNASNVLAAIEVGLHFGVSLFEAIEAISAYVPSNGRSQMVRTERNVLVVDAYNANLSSMNAALDNFAQMEGERKIVMLGDMKELGSASRAAHSEILSKVASMGVASYFVGPEFAAAGDDVPQLKDARFFPSAKALSEYLSSCMPEGALILVKGSHSTGMYGLADVL